MLPEELDYHPLNDRQTQPSPRTSAIGQEGLHVPPSHPEYSIGNPQNNKNHPVLHLRLHLHPLLQYCLNKAPDLL